MAVCLTAAGLTTFAISSGQAADGRNRESLRISASVPYYARLATPLQLVAQGSIDVEGQEVGLLCVTAGDDGGTRVRALQPPSARVQPSVPQGASASTCSGEGNLAFQVVDPAASGSNAPGRVYLFEIEAE